MKMIRLILSAAILWGFSVSCDNVVEMFPDNAPDTLYIIGCLDGYGGMQQVKVRKLIHGHGEGSMLINDPESYLPDSSARVYLQDPSGNLTTMNPVVYPRQTSGPVAQDSNVIWQLDNYPLIPDQKYTLKIDNPAMGQVVTSTLYSMPTAGFTYPVPASVIHSKFKFTDPVRPFHIEFTPASAVIWSVSLKYLDFMANGDTLFRKATFSGQPNYGGIVGREFDLPYLFMLFNRLIQDDPKVDFRLFYRFDFLVWTKSSSAKINGGMGVFYAVHHAILKNVCPMESFNSALADSIDTKHLKFSRIPYDGPYTDPDSTAFNPFFTILR